MADVVPLLLDALGIGAVDVLGWEKGERGRFYPYGKTYGQVFQKQE
jgi:hypothetical protein